MEKGNFDGLVNQIESTTAILCEDVKSVINRSVTARAWLTGFYIVEYEQHGSDRAKYGEELLKVLAKRLDDRSLSHETLKKNRRFYLTFPELKNPIASYLSARFGKGESPITQLPLTVPQIGESPITQL
ncbi:MAG: hypothetical protein IJS15_10025 [Victivallales bacterium]|nr:hypothetical protein [Victivallales bacterium]